MQYTDGLLEFGIVLLEGLHQRRTMVAPLVKWLRSGAAAHRFKFYSYDCGGIRGPVEVLRTKF